MFLAQLVKDIAEALLGIATSALVLRRFMAPAACAIGAAGHCLKARKHQRTLVFVRVYHVAHV
jgi:hypothetical protein